MKYLTKTIACMSAALSLMLIAPGCAQESKPKLIDAGTVVGNDGGVVMSTPTPAAEVVSGGGKLRGGDVEMHIQIGHPTSQRKTSGGNTTVEGNSAVKR